MTCTHEMLVKCNYYSEKGNIQQRRYKKSTMTINLNGIIYDIDDGTSMQ